MLTYVNKFQSKVFHSNVNGFIKNYNYSILLILVKMRIFRVKNVKSHSILIFECNYKWMHLKHVNVYYM